MHEDTQQRINWGNRQGGGGQVVAPTTASASFRFQPLEELSLGKISQDISPQEFEDWIMGFEDYMMTGTSDGDNIPDKFRVSYFMSKLDSWWKDRLRLEVDRTSSWETVVSKMHKVLLLTNPLFLRRVNTFALKQRGGQLFSEFCREHVKSFAMASCEKMTTEDLHLHLLLGAMQPGKLRDRLFAEKSLDMKKLQEMTCMFEEADVKKSIKSSSSSNQARKVTGQSDKKNEGLSCFQCGSTTHVKKDFHQMHGIVCGWCAKKIHAEEKCFSKQPD